MKERRGWPDRPTRRANLVRAVKCNPEWGADRIMLLTDQLDQASRWRAWWARLRVWLWRGVGE